MNKGNKALILYLSCLWQNCKLPILLYKHQREIKKKLMPNIKLMECSKKWWSALQLYLKNATLWLIVTFILCSLILYHNFGKIVKHWKCRSSKKISMMIRKSSKGMSDTTLSWNSLNAELLVHPLSLKYFYTRFKRIKYSALWCTSK